MTGKGRLRESRGDSGGRGGKPRTLGRQEGPGCDAEAGMGVEPLPGPPLEVPQANFLFEIFVVVLDPPAELGHIDQSGDRSAFREGGQPIPGGFRLTGRPFRDQPFLLGNFDNLHSSTSPTEIRPPGRGGRPSPHPAQRGKGVRTPLRSLCSEQRCSRTASAVREHRPRRPVGTRTYRLLTAPVELGAILSVQVLI
jgi:hypothetical protein